MNKSKKIIPDSDDLKYTIRRKRKDIYYWIFAIFILFLIYLNIKRRIDYYLVFSSFTQLFAFLIIILKSFKTKTVSGLSANTIICYCILLFSRLIALFQFEDYSPYDETGRYLHVLGEIINLILCVYLLYLLFIKYRSSADIDLDKNVPFYYFVLISFVFAIFFHSSLTNNLVCDISWAFSIYLETFAVFPQIYLFYRKKGKIESFTGHYVSLCGLSKIFALIFWWFNYRDLEEGDEYAGYYVLGSTILQLIIMADYYYLYFKSLLKGEQMNTDNI